MIKLILKSIESVKQMIQGSRKIALILDNATCHPTISLQNIKLKFFPSNTTSLIQPLDRFYKQIGEFELAKKAHSLFEETKKFYVAWNKKIYATISNYNIYFLTIKSIFYKKLV